MTNIIQITDLPLCTKQVAQRLGLSHRTLEGWRTKGTGPRYLCVGGRIRYRWSDVEAWMNGNHVTAGPGFDAAA